MDDRANVSWMPAGGPVTVRPLDGGALWRVTLSTPRANLIDAPKMAVLEETFRRARQTRPLKGILLEAAGPDFSFGASVQEHLPGEVERMIPRFHRLLETMLDCDVVALAAVRGRCLGGGLELVSFCHRIVAAPGARLGQPEIALGVFAPPASVVLPERIGRGAAEGLCLSGRQVMADEAHRLGLVDEVADDPVAAALAWAREFLLPRSASSLRLASRALRLGFAERVRAGLGRVERLYLDELMATRDAREGLQAFLDKRQPNWSDS